ncbi:MAG: hypothetical protein WDZ77_00230 [Candidatus Pacearchaeota archaeon]
MAKKRVLSKAARLLENARESAKRARESGNETDAPLKLYGGAVKEYRIRGNDPLADKIARESIAYAREMHQRNEKDEADSNYEGRFERKASYAFVILGIFTGLFFLHPNITGSAIAGLSEEASNSIGGFLVLFGILGAFLFYVRKKKVKK